MAKSGDGDSKVPSLGYLELQLAQNAARFQGDVINFEREYQKLLSSSVHLSSYELQKQILSNDITYLRNKMEDISTIYGMNVRISGESFGFPGSVSFQEYFEFQENLFSKITERIAETEGELNKKYSSEAI